MALDLHISTGATTPIYRQIVDQVCRAVSIGTLVPNNQLSSVRDLAEKLLVNPNTVSRAYGELVRDGVAEARQGKGVFITQRRQVYADGERRRRLALAMDGLINEAVYLDFEPDEIRQALDRRLRELERLRASAGSAGSGASDTSAKGRRS